VVEVLADLAKQKGYRIYRHCILDSDGKLVGYTPGSKSRSIAEDRDLTPTTYDEISMPKVEKIKIFLASPSDVATERKYVQKVVDEINRTAAPTQKVVLEVISSKNAFPGYGKDGQAILNEQIGQMHEYELFIGIMWNRIGTPTPRAKSGTIEEFTRTVKTLIRKGKPKIWFYFRQSPSNLNTPEELAQRTEVIEFRSKFQSNGLFKEYRSPAEFQDQLREHLNLWLNHRNSEVLKSRSAEAKEIKGTPNIKTKPESPIASERKKTASVNRLKGSKAKTTTVSKPSIGSQRTSTSKSSASSSTVVVKSPGNLVMLDGKFFQAKSSNTQADRSIILQILAKDGEQAAELKALHPGEFHNHKQITYADRHEAGSMQVSSVTTESSAGRTVFSITLKPNQRSQNSSFGMEINYPNYNADEVAELRTRLLLLGESLPKELRLITTQIANPYNQITTIEHGIFADLWNKLNTQSRLFLPRAWLWAVYYLKMSQIVEDILELELGPIKNKVMPIRFRGRRKQSYSNQVPSIITVTGSCTLKM
jgi:hypothetical protein